MPPRRRNGSFPDIPVTAIAVEGYKSLARRQRMDIRPLTLLAGANSSGKSSILQPLLLIKQTLDSPYDPGYLRIDGPNVVFSSNDQLFSQSHESANPELRLHVEFEGSREIAWKYELFNDPHGMDLVEMRYQDRPDHPV